METCFRCERNEKEVRLLDAIYENDMIKVCERCAITENIPVIRKPSTSQLRESEKSYSVYQRLKKLAGLEKQEKKTETILNQIRKLDESPDLEVPEEKKPFNLIDNFHWLVARARRNKGLSPRQLGWALGESESAIKMIEKGDLPEDSEKLIRKLEQFFQIKLRERTEEELEEERRKKEKAREEFKIKPLEEEPEFEKIPIKPLISELELDELELVSSIASGKIAGENIKTEESGPARVLSFEPEVMKKLTISDLKKMKEEREREEKPIKVEEERKKVVQEKRERELREKVAGEMKDFALGKETIREKEAMLDKAMKRVSKTEEKETIPTITELMERKKEKERARQQEKMTGGEIELEEDKL